VGRPLVGQLVDPYLGLFGQHAFLDFSAVFAEVGSPPEHELISDDSEGKVIDGEGVIFAAHDFGSHVARSATGVVGVALPVLSGDAEVGDSKVAL
jgi:hypothetical protein